MFSQIPNDIALPIIQQIGFQNLDFREDHLVQIINKNHKEYDLNRIGNLSDLEHHNDDIGIAARILRDQVGQYFTGDDSEHRSRFLYTLFVRPEYNMHDKTAFDSSLGEYWKSVGSLAYKLETEYFVIPIPKMKLPTKLIESDLNYYQKFLEKLKNRIIKIGEICANNCVTLLINFDPRYLFDHDVGRDIIKNNEINAPEHALDYCSPFRNFSDFRKFYDSLVETETSLGMFIDMSSYFISETNLIASKFIAEQIEDPPFENPGLFERFLLKNQNFTRNLFSGLKKIPFLKGIGFNDIEWFNLYRQVCEIKENITQAPKIEVYKLESQLNALIQQKCLPGMGSLPIKTFLLMLRDMNASIQLPTYYSLNPKLKLRGFNFESFDWRTIDLAKTEMRSVWSESIESYLKDKKRKFTRMHPDQDISNCLEPDYDDIKAMRIFSLYEIIKSIKKFYRFM